MRLIQFVSKAISVFVIFTFCNNTITNGQTLYEDAMKIADAIENQPHPIFYINSANNITINYQADKSANELTLVRWMSPKKANTSPKTRHVPLKKNGIYSIKISKSNSPNTGYITYGENNDTINFAGNDTISFKIINSIDQIFLMDNSSKMTVSNNPIKKKELIEIYGLLGKHSILPENKNADKGLTNYELGQQFNFIGNNVYLEPWLSDRKLSKLSTASTDSVLTRIKKNLIKNSGTDFSPEKLLHGDEKQRKFQSLKELELTYQVPPPESSEKLAQVSAKIKVKETKISNPLNAADLAAGLSDFVVERAQEEFNVAFMDRMRQHLNDDKFAEFRALFPESKNFFEKNIDIVNYKNLLPLARQSFITDIEGLHHNMHNLFELPKYSSLKNAPSIYNIVLFYEMVDLVYQDIPLDTIMPVAYNMLQSREVEFDQKMNFVLADKLMTNDSTLLGIKKEIKNANTVVSGLTKEIENEVFAIENKINDLIDKYETDTNTVVKQLGKSLIDFQRKYFLKTSLMNQRLFDFSGSFTIDEINAHLDGMPDYKGFLDNPKLENYHSLFDSIPNPTALIAAGLDKSKSFYKVNDNGNSTILFLTNYRRELLETQEYLLSLESIYNFQKNQEIPTRLKNYKAAVDKLRTELDTEITSLEADKNVSIHDIKAMEYLAQTIPSKRAIKKAEGLKRFSTDGSDPTLLLKYYLTADSPLKKIEEEETRKAELKKYLIERLEIIEKDSDYKSALLDSLTKQTPVIQNTKYQETQLKLDSIDALSNNVFTKIVDYEKAQSPTLFKAKTNAQNLAQLLEITTEMLYCFKLSPQNDKVNPLTGIKEKQHKYITKNMYKDLMANPLKRDIFLGMVQERLIKTAGNGNISSKGVATLTTSLMGNIQVISAQKDSLANDKDLKFKDYFPIIKGGINILNAFIETPLYNNTSLATSKDSTIFSRIPAVTNNTLSLFEHIYAKEYGAAIYDALEVFEVFAYQQQLTKGNRNSPPFKQELRKNTDVKSAILKYGTFMANVASAKNSEDVKNALKAAALPPGSSRIKRENDRNISLNAYLMFSAGADILTNTSIGNTSDRTGGTVGLSVPIGISFSRKFKLDRKFPSYTFFVSVLDIGAVTAFRIDQENNNTSTNYKSELLPELKFENLIAPGAFLYLNAGNSPFTFGVGAQYGPQLRNITVDGNPDITSSGSWRFLFNIGVDVPVFNLSTGSRRKGETRAQRKKRQQEERDFKKQVKILEKKKK